MESHQSAYCTFFDRAIRTKTQFFTISILQWTFLCNTFSPFILYPSIINRVLSSILYLSPCCKTPKDFKKMTYNWTNVSLFSLITSNIHAEIFNIMLLVLSYSLYSDSNKYNRRINCVQFYALDVHKSIIVAFLKAWCA